jgi:hypothetical protein
VPERHIALLGALLAALPPAALAKPQGGETRWIATGPGDQTDPSLDAGFVVFTNRDGNGTGVVLADLATGGLSVVAGPDASEPDLSRNVLAYRTPGGIALQFLLSGALLRMPAEPGAAAPAVTPAIATWEAGSPGDRDVAWYDLVSGGQEVIAAPGDQHAPAAAGSLVAFVDEAGGGAVMLRDVVRGDTRLVCEGRADSIAIDGAGASVRLAVARSAAGADLDVEVWNADGARLAALAQPGVQRNPRISGDWVAFEDFSTGRAVVVLWNHVTGLAFVPRPSPAPQALGDLVAAPALLSLAFSEAAGGGDDVALFTVPLPVVDDGTGSDWPPPGTPARCDDANPTVLATLLLARDRPEPQAGEVAFTVGDGHDLGVLLCIDEVLVDDARVALDGIVVASAADFAPVSAHLERRGVVPGGDGLVSAWLLAGLGSELRVRVLADPALSAGPPRVVPPADAESPGGAGPGLAAAHGPGGMGGCATGPAGLLALMGLAVQFAARRRPGRC